MCVKVVCVFPPPGSLHFGEGVDRNGKIWRWEFHEWMGPSFLRKDWETFLKRQPGEGSPAWEVFNKWLAERSAEQKKGTIA
jgi:hypothetical protein